MKPSVEQDLSQVEAQAMFVREGASTTFTVPVRFGLRRSLPSSPGRYLILLRQRHRARINQPWKWRRLVGEM